jgi:hypothetical protein
MDILIKPVGDLTKGDFLRYSLWAWYRGDPDSSMVSPIILHGKVIDDSEYDPVFVLCDIRLSDGTMYKGNVGVNIHRRQLYSLVFYKDEASFSFSGTIIPGIGDIHELSDWLQKPIQCINPLMITTNYIYADSAIVGAEIDLQTW